MTALSLFSGIGGIDLAAHHAGIKTAQFVERDPFCQAVLAHQFPGVPIWGDVTTYEPKDQRFDLIHGGFPCQDVSQANPWGEGIKGARSGLWAHFFRLIRDLRPKFVLVENVPGLITSGGLWDVLADLASIGLDAEWSTVRASDMGAPIPRGRVLLVASPDGERLQDLPFLVANGQQVHREQLSNHTKRLGRKGSQWRVPASGMATVADGFPPRLDDYHALGNAVCPPQIYPVLRAIAILLGGDPPDTYPTPWIGDDAI